MLELRSSDVRVMTDLSEVFENDLMPPGHEPIRNPFHFWRPDIVTRQRRSTLSISPTSGLSDDGIANYRCQAQLMAL